MEPTLEAQKSISTDNAIVVKGLRKSFKNLQHLMVLIFVSSEALFWHYLDQMVLEKLLLLEYLVRCFYRMAVRH